MRICSVQSYRSTVSRTMYSLIDCPTDFKESGGYIFFTVRDVLFKYIEVSEQTFI